MTTTNIVRIDWSDIDAFGHVNNLAIMRYIQTARISYLEQIGMLPICLETNTGPVMDSTTCHFKKPLIYPGDVLILSKVDHVKPTSLHMSHTIFNDAREVTAEANDVVVLFDFSKNLKHIIPDAIHDKICMLEMSPNSYCR